MSVELLELAAARLGELLDELVFVGGATVGLWITDPAAPEFRPTYDVDAIVEVSGREAYQDLERRLQSLGLRHDQESGVMCRFRDDRSERREAHGCGHPWLQERVAVEGVSERRSEGPSKWS